VSPSIITGPASLITNAGATVVFTVTAGGTTPLNYQWLLNTSPLANGGNLSGATTSTLTLTNVAATNAGDYSVVITNADGSVTSLLAILTVLVPPVITAQPQSQTNVVGTVAAFSVAVTGTAPLNYQWQFNGADIQGATGTSLTLDNAQPTDAGDYTVVLTNVAGSVTSSLATLTVVLPPVVLTPPTSLTNSAGSSASFAVTSAGTAPLSYQWLQNLVPLVDGGNISGAATAMLTLTGVSQTNAGDYTVVITNIVGSVTSPVATLTVVLPPVITAQPQSQTNAAGTVTAFSVSATGTAPLSYQWQFNGAGIPGATGTNLTLSNVQPTNAGDYTVVLANAAGSATSSVATLTVVLPPAVVTPPASLTGSAGSTATFTVTVTGTAPLSYQWLQDLVPLADGGNISGAAAAILTLTGVSQTNAGDYTVLITNMVGSVTSPVAALTVVVPPEFISITLLPDQNTSLSLTAVSNLTYRIDISTDFVNWTALTNLASSNSTLQFIDLDATNFAQRFYRAVWVP
jgi:hypothetical protein